MSINSDKLKLLVDFKKRIENKINQLESELIDLKLTLETLNYIIIQKGFKRGEIKKAEIKIRKTKTSKNSSVAKLNSKIYKSEEDENVIPLKTKSGESLAIMLTKNEILHILPDESKQFNINTPPFDSFLINRVLLKMKQKDEEFVKNGVMIPEETFSYDIITEGDLLKEIIIKNVDSDRLKELRSSVRWTFEKMFEKIRK